MRYADGELPARKAREVRSHLEACWQCRTELEELQETVKECVRYRKHVLQQHMPPPPARWMDIYLRMEEMDAAPEREPLLARIRRALPVPAARWAPAAIALALVCALVVYQWSDAPPVEAAALLRKAVAASEERPPAPRRIRIRTGKHQVSRVVAGPAESVDAAAAETLAGLEKLFRTANYSWDDPLSARSFQAWRDQLAARHDEVTVTAEHYRIRTTTEDGELMAATLKLDARDLSAVEGRLEFRNDEWVEITGMADAPAPPAPVAVAGSRPSTAPGHVAPPPEPPPATAASPSDELQVLAALQHVGADLGDPIEVTRAAGRILVSGVGIAPERQQEIHRALDAMPNVVLRFSEPGGAAAPPESGVPAESAAPGNSPRFHARLAEQMGGRLHFERLSAHLLDISESVMSRAYALRRLAHRFPPQAEAGLGPADLQLLRDLARQHAAAMAPQAIEVERLLEPVLSPLGVRAGQEPARTQPASWQTAAENLFHAARRVETLLAVTLGAAPGDAGDDLPSRLLPAVMELRESVKDCERLAAGDDGARGR